MLKKEKSFAHATHKLELRDPGPQNLFASTPFVQPQLKKVKTRVIWIWEGLGLLVADYLTTDQNGTKVISLITTNERRYLKQFATYVSHQLQVKLESKLLKAMKIISNLKTTLH